MTRYLPPDASGGVRRGVQWINALDSDGFELRIASPYRPAGAFEWTELPIGRSGANSQIDQPSGSDGASPEALGLLQRLRNDYLIPDPDLAWLVRHFQRLDDAFADVDVVVASAPPQSLHLVSAMLARRHGRRLVLDMRDPWLPSVHIPSRNRLPRRWIESAMRRYCLSSADAVTTVHPLIVEEVRAIRPDLPVHLVAQSRILSADHPDIDLPDDQLNLVFTGGFSASTTERTLADLIEAIEPMARANPQLHLHLLGGLTQQERSQAAACSFATAHGRQPMEKAAAFQSKADALVLFNSPSSLFPGGKLTEYVASGRPILVVGEGAWTQDPVLQRAQPCALAGTEIEVLLPDHADRSFAQNDRGEEMRAIVRAAAHR